MKKFNSVISLLLIIAVLAHGVLASLLMMGWVGNTMPIPAFISLGLLLIHIVLSCILSTKTIKDAVKSGDKYEIQNKMFIIRRVSGVLMMVFVIAHLVFYFGPQVENFKDTAMSVPQLVLLILLLISLIVHIVTNIRPLMVSLGVTSPTGVRVVLGLLIACALIAMAMAGVAFFLKW